MTQRSKNRIDLPAVIDDAQVRSYLDDGYLVVPDLVNTDERDELKAEVVKLARGDYPADNLDPMPPGATDAEALKRVLCIHQPHFVSPVIHKYVKHPKICGVLSQITAAHVPSWDGSVKCMQSMYFVKPPGFQGQAWHQDEIYIPTRDRSLVGAWIAVDDATIANGCMWVLPASQRTGCLYPQRDHGNPDEFDRGEESYGFDDSGEIPVEVRAGAVVFFNGYLLHRSRRNRDRTYRRALVSHYMNAWSLLPWSVNEGERPATADRRQIVTVAGIDPYTWKEVEPPPKKMHVRPCKASDQMLEPDRS